MPDTPQDAASLRARLNHHEATKAAAETERAGLIADRADFGALLNESELDEMDAAIARCGDTIERAGSRIALLAPAVAAAAAREAAADARQRSITERAVFNGETRRAVLDAVGNDPERHRIASQGLMAASGRDVHYSPDVLSDRPAPVVRRADEAAWHAAREARLAAEGGNTVPRAAPTSMDFGRPGPSAAATLLR